MAYYDEGIFKFGINHLGDINCLEESNDGSLWLGTNDAGLIRWNPKTDEKKLYAYSPGGNSIASNVIVSLLQAKDGKLWIGTFWEGLDCFDGNRFVHYRNRPEMIIRWLITMSGHWQKIRTEISGLEPWEAVYNV